MTTIEENGRSSHELLSKLIYLSFEKKVLKKAVFSKPISKDTVKAVMTPKTISSKSALQLEIFTADNKALHRNIFPDNGQKIAEGMLLLRK